jgi:hypothetical protein
MFHALTRPAKPLSRLVFSRLARRSMLRDFAKLPPVRGARRRANLVSPSGCCAKVALAAESFAGLTLIPAKVTQNRVASWLGYGNERSLAERPPPCS